MRSREFVRSDGRARILWQDFEALALGGLAEALVEADEVLTGSPSVGPEESGRKLEGIRSAKRMQQKDARSRFPDLTARLHLGPVSGEACHGVSSLVFVGAREDVVASSPCEGGITLDRRRPPDDDGSVRLDDFLHEGTW
jgi:hypothetical protein